MPPDGPAPRLHPAMLRHQKRMPCPASILRREQERARRRFASLRDSESMLAAPFLRCSFYINPLNPLPVGPISNNLGDHVNNTGAGLFDRRCRAG